MTIPSGVRLFSEGLPLSWGGQGGAVERVAEFYLLVVVAVAAFQAVGLIGLEIRYGGDLKPALLSRAPHLEVERYGRRERHVAAAEAQYVPGKAELFEQTLHVVPSSLLGRRSCSQASRCARSPPCRTDAGG